MGLYIGNTRYKPMVRGERASFIVEEPEFYDLLVFDGVAYVITDLFIPSNGSIACMNIGNELQRIPSQYIIVGYDITIKFGIWINSNTSSSRRYISWRYNMSRTQLSNLTIPFNSYPQVNYWMTPNRAGYNNESRTITMGTEKPEDPLVIGGSNYGNCFTGSMGTITIYNSDAQNVSSLNDLLQFTPAYTLRPCLYHNNAGFWNVEQHKFYGNGADSGSLSVINN